MRKQYINMLAAPVFYSIDVTKDMSALELEKRKFSYLKGCVYYDFKAKSFERIMDVIIVPAGGSNTWRHYLQFLDNNFTYDEALKSSYEWDRACGPDYYTEFTIVCVLESKSTGAASFGKNMLKNIGYVLGCIDVANSLDYGCPTPYH